MVNGRNIFLFSEKMDYLPGGDDSSTVEKWTKRVSLIEYTLIEVLRSDLGFFLY